MCVREGGWVMVVIKTEGYRKFVLGMKEKKCEIF